MTSLLYSIAAVHIYRSNANSNNNLQHIQHYIRSARQGKSPNIIAGDSSLVEANALDVACNINIVLFIPFRPNFHRCL